MSDLEDDVRKVAAEAGFTEAPPLVQVTGNWYRVDSLDAALAEAVAALPEGWGISVSRQPGQSDWSAMAGPNTWDLYGGSEATGYGPTPAAALRALTAKLRERAG